MTPHPQPLPDAARTELERLGARWRTLPLAQALRCAPALRHLAQRYADECACGPDGRSDGGAHVGSESPDHGPRIPDLGPATAYDQLRVLAYDAARRRDAAGRDRLADELAALRREVSGTR